MTNATVLEIHFTTINFEIFQCVQYLIKGTLLALPSRSLQATLCVLGSLVEEGGTHGIYMQT